MRGLRDLISDNLKSELDQSSLFDHMEIRKWRETDKYVFYYNVKKITVESKHISTGKFA